MKTVARLLAVAVLFVAANAFAANLDGNYAFKSRTKDGAPDLAGWQGTMTITKDIMNRKFKSADGKEEKFYVSTMKNEGGDIYNCKFTDAYKKDYIGMENKNNIKVDGKTLTMISTDGKFKEIWEKK